MTNIPYIGTELDLFSHARHWKSYWSSMIKPYLAGDVLEVGAGIGTNTPLLFNRNAKSWLCLEPDPELAARLESALHTYPELARVETAVGTTGSIDQTLRFDAIIYIDVLEHIEHDREELAHAAELLRPGGRIMVLSPAHQWLFTPFDQAIGHYRRYNRASLKACSPASCQLERLAYLDSMGILASLGNRLLLQQKAPELKQILFWDTFLVRPSRVLDPLLGYALGKSILGVWRKR